MKKALVVIDLTGSSEEAKASGSTRYHHLTGEEWTFLTEERLEARLIALCQSFKASGIETVRYCILFEPANGEEASWSGVLRALATLHADIVQISPEVEGFLLLPSLEAEDSAKSICHRFLERLNSGACDFHPLQVWLLDRDRVQGDPVAEILPVFLATTVYEPFNAEVRLRLEKEGPLAASSFGAAQIVFPAKDWRRCFASRLLSDMLKTPPLLPFKVTDETARLAVSELLPLLKEGLAGMARDLLNPARLPQADVLLEGILYDEANGLSQFMGRLMLHIQQEKTRRYAGMESDGAAFARKVQGELEQRLDESRHGPYSALGFIGLLLLQGGPYLEHFKENGVREGEPVPLSLDSFLFGWHERFPSPVLDLLLKAVVDELRLFYGARHLPFPEPGTWEALLDELSRLLEIKELEPLLGAERKSIELLKGKVEVILANRKVPFEKPFSQQDFEEILQWIEARARAHLAGIVNQVAGVKKRLEEAEERWQGLGWKKVLPFFWHLLLAKWQRARDYEQARAKLRGAYEKVMASRRRIFPCYLAPFVAEKLAERLTPFWVDTREFVSLIEAHRVEAEERVASMEAAARSRCWDILETPEEIDRLYHRELHPEDLPKCLPGLLVQLGEQEACKPALSSWYQSESRRKRFLDSLALYAQGKYGWVTDWHVLKAMAFLRKEQRVLALLQDHSKPMLRVAETAWRDAPKAFFVGTHVASPGQFDSTPFQGQAPMFYLHRDPEAILGLTLAHGLPVSAIEGWQHWKACVDGEER